MLQYLVLTPLYPAKVKVWIENKATGINYIDIYVRNGLYAPASLLSGRSTRRPGGRAGAGVSAVKPGDQMVYTQSAFCAYSEIHNLQIKKMASLPQNLSFEQATASFLKG